MASSSCAEWNVMPIMSRFLAGRKSQNSCKLHFPMLPQHIFGKNVFFFGEISITNHVHHLLAARLAEHRPKTAAATISNCFPPLFDWQQTRHILFKESWACQAEGLPNSWRSLEGKGQSVTDTNLCFFTKKEPRRIEHKSIQVAISLFFIYATLQRSEFFSEYTALCVFVFLTQLWP